MGGLLELGPTKEMPSPKYEDRAQDATSSRVEEPLMIGRASSAKPMVGSRSPSYQGVWPPFLWLVADPDDGECSWRVLHQGAGEGRERGAFLDDGPHSTTGDLIAGLSSLNRVGPD